MTPMVMAIRKTASTRSRVSHPSSLVCRFIANRRPCPCAHGTAVRSQTRSSGGFPGAAARPYTARRFRAERRELLEDAAHSFIGGCHPAVRVFALGLDNGLELARRQHLAGGVVHDIGAQRKPYPAWLLEELVLQPDHFDIEPQFARGRARRLHDGTKRTATLDG